MKTERVVLSLIAIVLGLLVAGVGFFIYQSTKTIPSSKVPTITIAKATPTPTASVQLSIDSPTNESVVDKKTLTITGKTNPDATIELITATDDQVVTPATTGQYSITTTLSDGENQIQLLAISPDGEETTKTITVTYSTEDF